MRKITVNTATVSFGPFCPGVCSNGGSLGKVQTRRRRSSNIKRKVGITWLSVDLVRDLRAAEKRA